MQPRLPIRESHSTSDPTVNHITPASAQHGSQRVQLSSSPLSQQELENGAAFEASSVISAPPGSPLAVPVSSGLSPVSTPPPQGRDRITEYENTRIGTKARKRTPGPVFEVIKKAGQSQHGLTNLLDLPNEILTHTFADLSPSDLTSISLVSRRLHDLVTTQHTWRAAFTRFFPGRASVRLSHDSDLFDIDQVITPISKREFTRLTALASWQSEYVLRTRLLRSLARGKPVQSAIQTPALRSAQSHTASPMLLYNSQLFTPINHLQADFGTGLNKRPAAFIHGADDTCMASLGDPATGKVHNWGLIDPTVLHHFADRYVGDAPYGLGTGQIVGVPNPMDVSSLHGMVCAEGFPGGLVYFRMVEEMRGRYLALSQGISAADAGIPKVVSARETICSLWIAKSPNIPALTESMIGILAGSSLGVLTAYSIGSVGMRDSRYSRGEMTARWVICPGVPIISICIDENYSSDRKGHGRIWAVVLNALGEVYTLSRFPKPSSTLLSSSRSDSSFIERNAWAYGRSVYWSLVETTRRVARPDPYGQSPVDGSYTPRSSWTGMHLKQDQIHAESKEIEAYLNKKPADFQTSCIGWDMRRLLEVDFANDDGSHAGETVMIVSPGLDDGSACSIVRHTRVHPKVIDGSDSGTSTPSFKPKVLSVPVTPSLFGGAPVTSEHVDPESADRYAVEDDLHMATSAQPSMVEDEWRVSNYTLGGLKSVQITATALDNSVFATSTFQEDPFLTISGASSTSSPSLTPHSVDSRGADSADIPGQRARLLAVGTSMGTVLLYNVRADLPSISSVTATYEPVRIIHTESPAITCMALSSLYLVVGGTDGLVQAWDPLASSSAPVRTLHSRFSSRARRRLAQAAASPEGVGINMFAAGAIVLDPDPTVLRGLVSLGTHLLFWHFSSSAADAYRSHKRRMRRSERLNNSGGEKYAPAPRAGGVKRFIESEKWELEIEEQREEKENARMAGRYGTELLGESATEEDLLAYAAMLSQEAFERDQERRVSITPSAKGVDSSPAEAAAGSSRHQLAQPDSNPKLDESFDSDMEEAIRQSLAMNDAPPSTDFEVPVKYAKSRRRSPKGGNARRDVAESSASRSEEELQLALDISRAEELSRRESYTDAGASQGQSNQQRHGKGKAVN